MFSIWRVCERFGILPPSVLLRWTDNGVANIANLLAYEQIREFEEAEIAGLKVF